MTCYEGNVNTPSRFISIVHFNAEKTLCSYFPSTLPQECSLPLTASNTAVSDVDSMKECTSFPEVISA